MTAFSPTPQFSKRWITSPTAVKQAFYQELDDIVAMLKSNEPANEFRFDAPDFGRTVADLLATHKGEDKSTQLVYGLDTRLTNDTVQTASISEQNLHELESRIVTKLSQQIQDFLSEHMDSLSDELKNWLRTAVKNELADHRQHSE